MALDPDTRQHLLELAYDVLPEDEAAELRRRIDSEPEVSLAYAEARTTADVLATAARLDEPKIALLRPASNVLAPEPKGVVRSPSVPRGPTTPRRRWVRETNWIVGIAAAALLVISLSGYFYHRGHLADIAADHLRLRVVGPSQLYRGAGNRYMITTTSVTGNPVSALVEVTLRCPGGEPLIAHKEKTDETRGELEIALPADLKLADTARLEIRAVYHDRQEEIGTRLAVSPVRYATYLSTDKARYRLGETVRYRSLTLSRLGLAADREVPVRFRMVDSRGTTLPGSLLEGTTRQGVGCGEFRVPEDAPAGRYTLVASSPRGDFPEQRRSFLVGYAEPPAAGREQPLQPGDLDIRCYPEGGELVAGLENRVYFTARDSLGKAVPIRGTVQDGEGRPVAILEATSEGRGAFNFQPLLGERYRLQVLRPDGTQQEAKLPAASTEGVLLSAGVGVFPAGRPLSFNVRATESGIPLVASAWCRGAEVGQQAVVTSGPSNPVELALDDQVAGVVRLTLYDYRSSPPKPVAERLVYRRPGRKLRVEIGEVAADTSTGKGVRLPVRVMDEKSKPATAVLGVAVAKGAAGSGGISMPSYFFLAGEIDRPEAWDSADFFVADDSKSAAALDLLLGTEGWRRFVETGPEAVAKEGGRPERVLATGGPPAVFDNLADLEERYRESLESYRANRTRPQNALTMLSLFGGVGLVVFVTMLAILNIPTGLRLWLPSVSAAVVCLAIAAVLMDPERLQSSPAGAVAFAPYEPAPAPQDAAPTGSAAVADRHETTAAERVGADAAGDELRRENADRDQPQAEAERGASLPASQPQSVPEDVTTAKADGPKKMAARPPASTAEVQPRRSISESQPAPPATAFKGKAGSQPATFVIRQYSYRLSPDARQRQSGDPETLYWHPLLLTDAHGRAAIAFDLPDTTGGLCITVDAHAVGGRLGSARREIKAAK